MALARLITHYGSTVASIAPERVSDDGEWRALLRCVNGPIDDEPEQYATVWLDASELRETAAAFMDLADEIDGRNTPA
jgi:hypothetical protein